MEILSGKTLSETIEQELQAEVAQLNSQGIQPGLTVIRVGEDPASEIYVRNKQKAAERVGILAKEIHLSASTTQDQLEAQVAAVNADPTVHGLLCQFPLPDGLNEERITHRIDPTKDVDCFHPHNFGLMAMGNPRFLPCTPAGVMEMLTRNKIETKGKRAVVLGRSNLVGRPMALLLGHHGADATVTVCHSRTQDLPAVAKEADILIVAIGRPEWVGEDMVKKGAVVIDVGIHRVEDATRKSGYRICGDVRRNEVESLASALSPVPGGVGLMTVTMLLKNTVNAARMRAEDGIS